MRFKSVSGRKNIVYTSLKKERNKNKEKVIYPSHFLTPERKKGKRAIRRSVPSDGKNSSSSFDSYPV